MLYLTKLAAHEALQSKVNRFRGSGGPPGTGRAETGPLYGRFGGRNKRSRPQSRLQNGGRRSQNGQVPFQT